MSGDSGTSKDKKKKDDAVAIDAADPYVVTGAYLTCALADGAKDVGCSLLDSTGERIKPTQVDSLDYSASVAGGAPIDETQRETNKWGAVWSGLSQLSKTKFNAAVTLDGKDHDFSCTGMPCTSRPSGSLSLTGLKGMIQSYNSALYVRDHLSDDPDVFCSSKGDPISDKVEPISEKTLEVMAISYTPKNSNMFTGDFWQATGSSFAGVVKVWSLSDKPKIISQFDNPFCLITKGSQLYFEGSKCIVAGVRRSANAQPTVLIYKKTQPPQTTQLQMIPACK
jgi:hypothetical protein